MPTLSIRPVHVHVHGIRSTFELLWAVAWDYEDTRRLEIPGNRCQSRSCSRGY
jgi:hypothetical protein